MLKAALLLFVFFSTFFATAAVVQAACEYPGTRNCNALCQHLPSYPAYEKEDCITQCVAEDQAALNDYYTCLDQQEPAQPQTTETIETTEADASATDLPEVPDVGPGKCVGLQSPYTLEFVPADQLKWGCDNTCFESTTDEQIPCTGATDSGVSGPTQPEPAEEETGLGKMETASNDVDTENVNSVISDRFPIINQVFRDLAGRNAKITSGYREGGPGKKFSYHQTGDAVDLRINDMSLEDAVRAADRLRSELGSDYDVCLEVPDPSLLPPGVSGCVIKNIKPHIHVEYDRNRVEANKPAAASKYPEPPPPIVFNHELPGEEEAVGRPGLLSELKDAWDGRQILFDETIKMPEGLDVRVDTSPKDVAIWGAEVVGEEVAWKVVSYALPEEVIEVIKDELSLVSDSEAVYDITQQQTEPQISGSYSVGPFTVEIKYLPELIPDGYTEDDVGLFHLVVSGGKAALSKVRNYEIDKENNRIFGRVDGFSVYTVGVLKEDSASELTADDWITVIAVNVVVFGGIGAGVYFAIRAIKRRKKVKAAKHR